MPQGIPRAVPWLAAACLVLGGCAEMPDAPAVAQAPAAPAFDPAAFQRDMQRLKSADPDEIRRRFGAYELLMGETFVSHDSNPVALSEYRWVVPGALARVDYLNCYEQTRKCDEGWFWVQYDASQKRLNFLNASNGVAWAHADVQPDGAVNVSRPNGAPYEVRFDFDKDEGLFTFPSLKRMSRYIPTERQQYADARKQWKQVDAETRAEELRVARAQEAERQRVAQEQAAERRRAEREADAERWNNINRAIAGMGQAYRETADQHRRNQADVAARNARLASSLQSSRPTPSTTTTSAPRTVIPSTSTLNRPTATTLAPVPLTPLPKAATARSAPASTSSRTPVPLKTNPLQPPRLSEQTLVAPQQAQTRAPAPSTTTSASARVEKPVGPPGTTISVPRRETAPKPAPTVVATAPSSTRDPAREWEERRQRDQRGERDEGGGDRGERRDPGSPSTRDDPNRCITAPIEAKPVIGSAPKCSAFRVYNRCSAPLEIKTCVYLTAARKWSCEQRSVAPNGYKQHESCSPHGERFVSVRYSDDNKTRMAMPPGR